MKLYITETGVQLPPAPPNNNPKQTYQILKTLENIDFKGFFYSPYVTIKHSNRERSYKLIE
ncbi:hypothetical protein EUX54_01600 [Haemophilus haemolyticus]|uniref:Uncharacterized protein n=1 Tax=Haemophilus haemolyticus TaxID=726 RepID=A0A502KDA8_HAEHA|nr:hypothetical protein EUX54_01600 [Haemophilus haemolyticus]TPH07513.1 hypothetical protein EUX50_01670 [Haemophilus haemolyticus]